MSVGADDRGSRADRHPLIVVTPIYEDREASSTLFRELTSALEVRPYIVAVDDGSIHEPVSVASIASAGLAGEVLRLKRNVGHQRAIAIGLSHVAVTFPEAELIVVMDSDGEDTPRTIPLLVNSVAPSDVDMAVAERRTRVETFRFRTMYWTYKRIFELLVGRRINFGNYMILKQPALQRLVTMPELWIHLPGCVLCSRLRVQASPIDRGRRYSGQSKMNFVALALHGFKGLMVFSEELLVRMGVACTIVAIGALIGGAAAITMKLLGYTTPGWSTVVLGVLLLLFLQMGALTLMMLMLTGLTRASAVVAIDYRRFIADRLLTESGEPFDLAPLSQ